jgi:hypothetical protein
LNHIGIIELAKGWDWATFQAFCNWVLSSFSDRLTIKQVARRLHTTVEGVYLLTFLGLLRPLPPLDEPLENGTTYYSRADILLLSEDEAWLGRMCFALVAYKWAKHHAEAITATTQAVQKDKSRGRARTLRTPKSSV